MWSKRAQTQTRKRPEDVKETARGPRRRSKSAVRGSARHIKGITVEDNSGYDSKSPPDGEREAQRSDEQNLTDRRLATARRHTSDKPQLLPK